MVTKKCIQVYRYPLSCLEWGDKAYSHHPTKLCEEQATDGMKQRLWGGLKQCNAGLCSKKDAA